MNELLPIGSVVKTTYGKSNILIVGYGGIGTKDTNKVFEYTGFIYPFGYRGEEDIVMFNYKDITEVVFENAKFEEYKETLDSMYNIIKQHNGGNHGE